jgi:hypothetical protein
MSAQIDPAQAGNITKFKISSNLDENSIDLSTGVVDYRYYESVLSNNITATATIVESGFQSDDKGNPGDAPGTIDGLPIRGGERTDITIEDTYGNELKLDDGLYVNRVRDVDPGTQTDVYFLDFASKEYFANEQTRVRKRFEGKISDSVKTILQDVLMTDMKIEVDNTAVPFNFIGNERKPFYTCTWLASKSIPEKVEDAEDSDPIGGAAGYLFFQTREEFKFKGIDNIFSGESTKKYIYNNTPGLPEGYDAKVLTYDINRDIDLQENLMLGTYNNRSIFFDYFAFNYKVVPFNITEQSKKIAIAGKDGKNDMVAKEFTASPTRLMNHILDVGTLPKGITSNAQLEEWRNERESSNYKAEETTVQSIMRYNQIFSIKTQITIPGDFSIKAGDLVTLDVPELKGSPTKELNPESGGIYMVASVCHRVTPGSSLTSLDLVRDSYGKKPTGMKS